eukprot:767012-Hanusia_phi.AAC.11
MVVVEEEMEEEEMVVVVVEEEMEEEEEEEEMEEMVVEEMEGMEEEMVMVVVEEDMEEEELVVVVVEEEIVVEEEEMEEEMEEEEEVVVVVVEEEMEEEEEEMEETEEEMEEWACSGGGNLEVIFHRVLGLGLRSSSLLLPPRAPLARVEVPLEALVRSLRQLAHHVLLVRPQQRRNARARSARDPPALLQPELVHPPQQLLVVLHRPRPARPGRVEVLGVTQHVPALPAGLPQQRELQQPAHGLAARLVGHVAHLPHHPLVHLEPSPRPLPFLQVLVLLHDELQVLRRRPCHLGAGLDVLARKVGHVGDARRLDVGRLVDLLPPPEPEGQQLLAYTLHVHPRPVPAPPPLTRVAQAPVALLPLLLDLVEPKTRHPRPPPRPHVLLRHHNLVLVHRQRHELLPEVGVVVVDLRSCRCGHEARCREGVSRRPRAAVFHDLGAAALEDRLDVLLVEPTALLLRLLLEQVVRPMPQKPLELLLVLLARLLRPLLPGDHRLLQPLLLRGSLQHPPLIRLHRDQPVDLHLPRLPDPVAPCLRLQVVLRVPVAVEDDDCVGCRQVDPHPSRLGADEKYEAVTPLLVVAIDRALSHVPADPAVDALKGEVPCPHVLLEHVEHADELAEDQDTMVLRAQLGEDLVEEDHLARVKDQLLQHVRPRRVTSNLQQKPQAETSSDLVTDWRNFHTSSSSHSQATQTAHLASSHALKSSASRPTNQHSSQASTSRSSPPRPSLPSTPTATRQTPAPTCSSTPSMR